MSDKKRRGRGEGSIHFDDSRGVWVAQLSSVGPDGKRRRQTFRGKTKATVQTQLRKAQEEPKMTRETMTLRKYLDGYRERRKAQVAPETWRTDESLFEHHVLAYIGNMRLRDIDAACVMDWFARLSAAGVPPGRQHKAAVRLGTALREAVILKLIPHNPVSDVRKPRREKNEVTILTPEQARLLVDESVDQHFHPLYMTALTSGARPGELFGLAWDAIDWKANSIRIVKSLEEVNGRLRLKPTKNKSSRRTIALPETTMEALDDHRQFMEAAGIYRPDAVFTSQRGDLVRKSNFHRRHFKPLLAKLKLPDVTFHALRHTHAAMLIAGGENVKVIQSRLGHSSIQTTLDEYGHLFQDAQASSAATMESIFGDKPESTGTQ